MGFQLIKRNSRQSYPFRGVLVRVQHCRAGVGINTG